MLPAAAVGELANPVHQGWMHKEGHRRKTFKKRYFVVWPRDFSDCGMDAPVLFYFEDDQPERRPKGTVSLANLKCRLPKKPRTIKIPGEKDIGEFCFRVDIDGAPEGHNKFIFATESQQEMIRTRPTHPKLFVDGATTSRALCVRGCAAWMETLESASSHEDALGKQLQDRRATGVGHRRNSVLAQMESAIPTEGTPPASRRTASAARTARAATRSRASASPTTSRGCSLVSW